MKAFAVEWNGSEIGDWYLLHLSLKERRIDRFKVKTVYLVWYLRLIFTPNAVDKTIFHLPKLFYPFYFVMRPLRLFFNYLRSSGVAKQGPS